MKTCRKYEREHHKLRATIKCSYFVYHIKCNPLALRELEALFFTHIYMLRVRSYSWPPPAFRMRKKGKLFLYEQFEFGEHCINYYSVRVFEIRSYVVSIACVTLIHLLFSRFNSIRWDWILCWGKINNFINTRRLLSRRGLHRYDDMEASMDVSEWVTVMWTDH